MTDDAAYPDVQRRMAERNELIRIAAQSVLDAVGAGRIYHPETITWAKHWAAIKPLSLVATEGVDQ